MPRPKVTPTSAPKARSRDYAREAAGRATSRQTLLSLTPEERALLESMATDLGAPFKQTILACLRAGRALLDGEGAPTARKLLRADLEPTKPGPKIDTSEE